MLFQGYYVYGSDCEGRFILLLLFELVAWPVKFAFKLIFLVANMHALLQLKYPCPGKREYSYHKVLQC